MHNITYIQKDLFPNLDSVHTTERRFHSLINALALYHDSSWKRAYKKYYLGTLHKKCEGPSVSNLDAKILRLNYFHGSSKNIIYGRIKNLMLLVRSINFM